jgi:predicted CoA-binding protein
LQQSVAQMATHPDLDPFLSGNRLAFVGVSISPDCPTRELFRTLVARGHEVIPIRAGVSEIEDVKAYASVQLAGELDGVVVMTSPRNAARALEDCHVAGVRRVWLIGDDVNGDARAFASLHSIELVVLRDPIAALDHGQSLLRRITGRLRRITGITQRIPISGPPIPVTHEG